MPKKIVVVFHSATGVTRDIAGSIVDGVSSVDDTDVDLIEILGRDIQEGVYDNPKTISAIDNADAVIFGSPTFMGSVSAQFKAFADATGDLWAENRWTGKIAAGFTVGSNLCGDQLSTIQYFSIFAAQHGMLWCGLDVPGGLDAQGINGKGLNRLGAQGGLIAHTPDTRVDPIDRETAKYLGQRVAKLCKKMQNER